MLKITQKIIVTLTGGMGSIETVQSNAKTTTVAAHSDNPLFGSSVFNRPHYTIKRRLIESFYWYKYKNMFNHYKAKLPKRKYD
jgi:hypothetical protein